MHREKSQFTGILETMNMVAKARIDQLEAEKEGVSSSA